MFVKIILSNKYGRNLCEYKQIGYVYNAKSIFDT